jgi:hypothetical protein
VGYLDLEAHSSEIVKEYIKNQKCFSITGYDREWTMDILWLNVQIQKAGYNFWILKTLSNENQNGNNASDLMPDKGLSLDNQDTQGV